MAKNDSTSSANGRLAQARLEGRLGGRRCKLGDKKRREIAESVISGRKSGAEMARLCDVSEPTVSRIVAEYRQSERGA
jgi:CRP-like cAMP-binding protein